MDGERKLVPILREGIEIVKLIFFKELRDHLYQQRAGSDPEVVAKLTAAVVNTLFGVENREQGFMAFVRDHRQAIGEILVAVGSELPALRIPLTDALRTMVLCDFQAEGRDSSPLLHRAREAGILLTERDLPLPHDFIDLVRRLGTAKGVLQPSGPGA